MTLREYLTRPTFQRKLEQSAHRTSFPTEEVMDAIYDVVAKMLTNEERFKDSFPNEYALLGYIRKVAFRALFRKSQRKLQPLLVEPVEETTPEELLLRALEHASLLELTKHALDVVHLSGSIGKDVEHLFHHLLNAPEKFVKKRQSGQDKGTYALDMVALSKALGWKRTKTYDRMERLASTLRNMLEQSEGL